MNLQTKNTGKEVFIMWETPIIEIAGANENTAEVAGDKSRKGNYFVKNNQVACDHISCC